MRVYPAQNTGFVAVTSIMPSPDSAGMEVALYRGSDEPLIVYGRRLAPYDPYGNFQSVTQMICTTDLTGRIYLADVIERQFSIVCMSADGDTLFLIDIPHEPVRRPREELDAQLD